MSLDVHGFRLRRLATTLSLMTVGARIVQAWLAHAQEAVGTAAAGDA